MSTEVCLDGAKLTNQTMDYGYQSWRVWCLGAEITSFGFCNLVWYMFIFLILMLDCLFKVKL